MAEAKSANYTWDDYLRDADTFQSNVKNTRNLDKETFKWARDNLPSVLYGNNKKRNQKKSVAEIHKMRNYRRHKDHDNARFLKFIKGDFRRAKNYKERSKTVLGRILNMPNPLGMKNLANMAATTRLNELETPTFDGTFNYIPDADDATGIKFDPSEEYEELGQNLDDALASAMPRDYISVNMPENPIEPDEAFTRGLTNPRGRHRRGRTGGSKKHRTKKRKHKKKRKTRRKKKTKKTKRRRPKRRRTRKR